MKMIERLLLHRVDGQRTGLAIDLADQHTTPILPAAANARLAVRNPTVVRAELALHSSILQLPVIPTLHIINL